MPAANLSGRCARPSSGRFERRWTDDPSGAWRTSLLKSRSKHAARQRGAGNGHLTALYPETDPYEHGMLDVGDGQRIYWEACGNRKGKPALVLHGGPGSGCSKNMRRPFDPDAYRVILFDQRQCGRSEPHASDPSTDLNVNTTEHLLTDIELLRARCGIDSWLIFGGSWGCTLALAYAERHPDLVTGLVLAGITTTRRSEIDWLYRGVGPLYPEQYARFLAGAGREDGDIVDAYRRLLADPDPAVRGKAAREWCEWENALVSIDPEAQPPPRRLTPQFEMAFARIVTHYFSNGAWLEEGQLLRHANRLAVIPGLMIHGRFDMNAPLVTAWELARAWPGSELVIVENAGHSGADPGMTEALVAALDGFR